MISDNATNLLIFKLKVQYSTLSEISEKFSEKSKHKAYKLIQDKMSKILILLESLEK